MRLSSPFTIMALAIMKPPMKRNIMGLAKGAKASFIFTTPNTTHSVGPMSEVTGMGTGSVIHHRPTRVMMASNLWASGERPAMGGYSGAAKEADEANFLSRPTFASFG